MNTLNVSLAHEAGAAYTLMTQTIFSRLEPGTNLYNEDWDLLIVLDACRVDAIKQLKNEFGFLPDEIDSVWSQGSTSKEWVERTFSKNNLREINETAMVSANPFAEHILREEDTTLSYLELSDTIIGDNKYASQLMKSNLVDERDFFLLDILLGEEQVGEEDAHHHHPQKVTDHAIQIGRDEQPERCIVHYMQPHAPYFVSCEDYEGMTENEKDPFGALKSGEWSFDEIFEAYIENLRYVLKHVSILLSNYNAEKVVITSDHGELFGEWGIYNHKAGILHPSLRKVPWVETSAKDSGEYSPEVSNAEINQNSEATMEQLEALGYK